MKRLIIIAMLFAFFTSGCTARIPPTHEYFASGAVGAMVPLPDGGLRYAERDTGRVWDVNKSGVRTIAPIAQVSVSTGDGHGFLGMIIDDQKRTFASWTNPYGELVVGQIAPGPTRVIWNGPMVTLDTNTGGTMAFTPTKRILIGIGDFGDHAKIQDNAATNGKLLTLDPNRGTDQRPNLISKGWTNPLGLAYNNDLLWVADGGTDGVSALGRANDTGFSGKPTKLGANANPGSLTNYGDQELVACLTGTHRLQRYLINDEKAVRGRQLAKDCTGAVAQLSDESIVYIAGGDLRVTAK